MHCGDVLRRVFLKAAVVTDKASTIGPALTDWEKNVPISPLGNRGTWKNEGGDAIRRALARNAMRDVLGMIAAVGRQKYREKIRGLTPEQLDELIRVLGEEG